MDTLLLYLRATIFVVIVANIFIMHVWIIGVAQSGRPLLQKRIIIVVIVLISTIFTFALATRPYGHKFTPHIGNILACIYLGFIVATVYWYWPRYMGKSEYE